MATKDEKRAMLVISIVWISIASMWLGTKIAQAPRGQDLLDAIFYGSTGILVLIALALMAWLSSKSG